MTIYNNQRPATADEIYKDMCERITNFQLQPGQKISENQMSEDYGVSRSVIRTVFTRLSERKLVEVYPQRGTYISKMDLEFISDLLLLRTAIEKEILYEIFPKPVRKIVSIFIGLVVTAVLGFLCYTSIGYLQLFMRTGRTTAVLNLPFTWIYIIVPVSCMLQIFNYFLVNVFGYEDEVEKLVEEDEDE